jgi:hypothetical protein
MIFVKMRTASTSQRKFTVRLLMHAWCGVMTFWLGVSIHAQQIVDPDFKATVEKPAYSGNGPTVAIDEAHSNFHTAGGQYKPFADLVTNDGYRIKASTRKFELGTLDGVDVLVIANANARNFTDSAFSEAECDVVRDWVRNGGSLLLIADHGPYGNSTANLAARFGIKMGNGWVFEPGPGSVTTQLTFSRENGLLGQHQVLRGRNPAEEVKTIRTFTGQSLSLPVGAVALMNLSAAAREAPNTNDLDAEEQAQKTTGERGAAGTHSVSVAGRVQGLATQFGKGKLVVLGEAALFSAQVVTLPQGDRQVTFKAGMNVEGNDNRQFALNALHWLSGALQ